MDTKELPLLPLLIATAIGMFGMWVFGAVSAESRMQTNAVKANVAYWTVDERGAAKFHWITE